MADDKVQDILGLAAWYRLSRAYHYSLRRSNAYLKEYGLSAAQFDVLVQIGTNQELSQKELAEKLLVTKGNITKLLVKMEMLGWIERRRVHKVKYLTLTEMGEALFNEVVPKQEDHQISHFDALDEQELRQLVKLLKKLEPPT
ncbi:MarR family winged helix-turn-helix transcriptional regulator [Bacillus sp. Marseille-P3800]|uniref:MarR family winged helix-turn-helix transcriptional regulator n=1 Tax=Bacillus sp. Marseille-P3800 TaxID=2014782 RepID=UPI000C07DABA|nr:MarR family transcriptional regulator [Bacillus sp. Marseille-P3800]